MFLKPKNHRLPYFKRFCLCINHKYLVSCNESLGANPPEENEWNCTKLTTIENKSQKHYDGCHDRSERQSHNILHLKIKQGKQFPLSILNASQIWDNCDVSQNTWCWILGSLPCSGIHLLPKF